MFIFLNIMVLTGITVMPLLTPMLVPMKACIPMNDKLTSAAGPLVDDATGALGGLLLPLAIIMTVVVILVALAKILSRDGREYFRLIPWPGIILVGGAVVILLVYAIFEMVNNACS